MSTYSRCKECGHREEGVCGLMFGHKCESCGAVDAATIVRRRPACSVPSQDKDPNP